ncbi:hypothetical protein PCC8801_2239 [Rippkaea orientalis PCC 8801]|uniref:Uncharacterized protein n=1 Tax=Rippkaea orientalis (strain PCC 8801 / RF-1) TaxID=41431 RepID=B7K169_RIPO1|nr:hypothetical protein PCC8801_2239 [Rippkaea orientalis PCC 8801]
MGSLGSLGRVGRVGSVGEIGEVGEIILTTAYCLLPIAYSPFPISLNLHSKNLKLCQKTDCQTLWYDYKKGSKIPNSVNN